MKNITSVNNINNSMQLTKETDDESAAAIATPDTSTAKVPGLGVHDLLIVGAKGPFRALPRVGMEVDLLLEPPCESCIRVRESVPVSPVDVLAVGPFGVLLLAIGRSLVGVVPRVGLELVVPFEGFCARLFSQLVVEMKEVLFQICGGRDGDMEDEGEEADEDHQGRGDIHDVRT
ncbi:hypothetical protein H6P81_020200 [Aristolochia fimbriata]|uniref:Uncharacterized protein n=1 Tax=Aristolochia fimbriata TaxID=158543 RepID=A0AAV7DVN6_ARIFI|nr:hypothetical protein H6P81_020200 [Aristolochia fimbriata]